MAGSGYLTGLSGQRSAGYPAAGVAEGACAEAVAVLNVRCDMELFLSRSRPAGRVWNVGPQLQGLQYIVPYWREARRVIRPVIKRQQHLDIATDANGNARKSLAELLWVDEITLHPHQVQVGSPNGDNLHGRREPARIVFDDLTHHIRQWSLTPVNGWQ